ncbi:MAG: tetratricopeptide repeat protein, partial [Gammaproteobacteria bacterium]
LRKNDPNRIAYIVAEAEIYMAQSRYEKARDVLEAELTVIPESYALGIYYAQTLLRTQSPDKAAPRLRTLLRDHPNDPQLWRLLSEAYGATGNIVGVHEARAEVFFLYNRNEQALQPLRYALDLTKENFPRSAKIKQRMQEIQAHSLDLRG